MGRERERERGREGEKEKERDVSTSKHPYGNMVTHFTVREVYGELVSTETVLSTFN